MKNAIENNIDPLNSNALRNYFYTTSIETPAGTLTLDKSNYIPTYSYILQFNKDDQPIISQFSTLISPLPYYSEVYMNIFQLHDDKYLYSDFSLDNPIIQQEREFIGIGFVLDLDDTETTHSYYDYLQSIAEIVSYNINGGIRQARIRYELYNCPKSDKDASDIVVNLKDRGFNYLVGGCNPTTKNYLRTSLKSIDSILFYTNMDRGNECIQNMYFILLLQSIYFNYTISRNNSKNFIYVI